LYKTTKRNNTKTKTPTSKQGKMSGVCDFCKANVYPRRKNKDSASKDTGCTHKDNVCPNKAVVKTSAQQTEEFYKTYDKWWAARTGKV
jgi:hypothetical protein